MGFSLTPDDTGMLARQLRNLRHRPRETMRNAFRWAEVHLRPPQAEGRLAEDAQGFWTSQKSELLDQYSHWRGAGIFADDARWLALGAKHLEIYRQFARLLGTAAPPRRIVEWGCGGGANAVHFAPMAETYVGVDIAEASLAECGRQLEGVGFGGFEPVLVEAASPEAAVARVGQKCDLFLSTYVFEILPSPESGLRLLSVARDLLADGGMAMIQVRYMNRWSSRPRRFAYKRSFPNLTTYHIDSFWTEAEARGFKPQAVRLVPREALNGNTNYAYFLLTT